MKGYVVMDAEIIDIEAYAEFAKQVPPAVAAHGGRILVRTSNVRQSRATGCPSAS